MKNSHLLSYLWIILKMSLSKILSTITGWPWNASGGIWRALCTLNHVSEARILFSKNFMMRMGREIQMSDDLPHVHVFFIGVWFILWKYKKQPTAALSMTEAEDMATSHCMKETIWLRQLLTYVDTCEKSITTYFVWVWKGVSCGFYVALVRIKRG